MFSAAQIRRIFVLFLLLMSSVGCLQWKPAICMAEIDDPVATYQKNRQEFVNKQRQAQSKFNLTAENFEVKISAAKEKFEIKDIQIQEINNKTGEFNTKTDKHKITQFFVSSFLLPLLTWAIFTGSMFFDVSNWPEKFLLFGLALCVLNVGIFLLARYKNMEKKHRILIVIGIVFFITSITSPLFASDLENREEVISKLELVGKILSQSEHERFIAILESKPSGKVSMPPLASGDNHFSVFRKITSDSPEYWYTLAALYTHENKKGGALDAVRTMIENVEWSRSEQHQKMILNCVGYLLQEQQTELVTKAIDSLITKIDSPLVLLDLADLLEKHGMHGSSEKVLAQAINRAATVQELVELAEYFAGKEERIKGDQALNKAMQKIRNIDELILILNTAIKMDRDDLINIIIPEIKGRFNERMRVVDLFMKSDRKEDAISVFSKMIDDASKSSSRKKDTLLYLINAALERNLLPQATNATRLLFIYLSMSGDKDMNFPIAAGQKLETAQGIPDENKIMLPQFYGLLNEEQQIYDEAEVAYIKDVMGSLEEILQSYGYTFPDTLNSFFLLGRIWVKDNKGELLQKLDTVYSIIEAQFLAEQEQVGENKLTHLKDELDSWETKCSELEGNYDKAVAGMEKSRRHMIAQIISTFSSILFIILLFTGCIIISYQYCRKLQFCKTFGFFTKFVETTGWVRILSVFGAISGIISVVFAQFLQIIQHNQENTRATKKLCEIFMNNQAVSVTDEMVMTEDTP